MSIDRNKEALTDAGLKVTPQRLAVLEAVHRLENHPTAEHIIEYIRKIHPNVATGTVYKVLDILVEKDIIRKVRTEKDIMRYEGNLSPHHHLYCASCDVIEDYLDPELDQLLKEYFDRKHLPGFTIQEIKVEIKGEFDTC